ncbi:MAG TPA: hypothetical protein VFE30_02555 [Anaeromyxobacteraceae bacterium]|jgi:rhodanese-related sulfurtransferase|nr:hypothetical protein [Anaeromyxobacteraceae bacterium]
MEIPRITPQQVRTRQDRGEEVVFLDARSAAAWSHATDRAPGAIRVPPDQTDAHVPVIPKGKTLVAYCT